MFTNLIQASDIPIGDDDWAVIDARFYLPDPEQGEREYLEGHVPGAVYARLDRDLSGEKTGVNGRHPLPTASFMAERFSQWGIDDQVQVVVYDSAACAFASRLWWMLRYLGHDRVAVLDGGFAAFSGELSSGPEMRRARTFTPAVRASMHFGLEAVLAEGDKQVLLDARAGERFRGETETLDPVAGHIPGARNLPSMQNVGADGRFLDGATLRERFDAVTTGRPADEVVCYCGSGVTACHNLLAMDVAGLKGAKLYSGSWSEWCADPDRPIETGDAR